MNEETVAFLKKQIEDLALEQAKAQEFVVKAAGGIAAYQIALKKLLESEPQPDAAPNPAPEG